MIPSDFFAVLQWWFIIFLLGIGFLPVTFILFRNFFDKGYLFSKLLGLAITSYAIFVFGILHIFPFSMNSAYFIFLLIAGAFYLLLRKKISLRDIFKTTWKTFLFEELLFFFCLLAWAFIHTYAPDIHGLEKYMDFGFVNSILRAEYFPPKDMWFTPEYINYYYFGHFMTAILTKLSGIPSAITFNLMLSTIFAFCFTETFSIGGNLFTHLRKNNSLSNKQRFFTGILTAMLVTLAGNLHILYGFFKAYPADNPLPFWQLQFLPQSFPNAYWYPNATRYIFHTIHEFPIYSWVVADLHGHVLDIPFVLLIIALLFAVFINHQSATETVKKVLKPKEFLNSFLVNPVNLILIGFLLGIMYMTNAWDGAIYFILAALVILYLHWQRVADYKTAFHVTAVSKKLTETVREKWFLALARDSALSILFIISSFLLFNLPYSYFFKPFVSGIGVLCATDIFGVLGKFIPAFQGLAANGGKIGPIMFETAHCQHSIWWELMVLYGFFYFFVVSFIIYLMRAKRFFYTDTFVLLLIFLSTLLIILPEFIYVKDIYPAHFRANTMFKLVFQAFMMLGISSAYIIVRMFQNVENEKKGIYRSVIFPIVTIILVALVMTYPYIAINSYYNNFKNPQTLDGTMYLSKTYPSDYLGILWLNKNVSGQPIVLEAQGDSYTDYARVSANTGLPTVLGWTVHEWLWRGSYDIPAPRINDVKIIYETKNPIEAKNLLNKYKVKYIFIGTLETQKYPQLDDKKFHQLGKQVFSDGTTKIFEIND